MTNELENYGWDDEIEDNGEGGNFNAFPAGTIVKFKVINFEKVVSTNQNNMAVLTLRCIDQVGNHGLISTRLVLVSKAAWVISSFFESIGLKQKGEKKFRPKWGQVLNSEGFLKTKKRTYTGVNGERITDDIDAYISASDAPNWGDNDDTQETAEPDESDDFSFNDDDIPF